jgi:hypothetical protein
MRVSIGLTVDLAFPQSRIGVWHMDKWAQQMAEKIKAGVEAKRLKDSKFMEVQRLKREQGGPLWDQVRVFINEKCASLNAEMQDQIVTVGHPNSKETRLRASISGEHDALVITFDQEASILKWKLENTTREGQYKILVDDNGNGYFQDKLNQITPEAIAEYLIGELLGFFNLSVSLGL